MILWFKADSLSLDILYILADIVNYSFIQMMLIIGINIPLVNKA